MEGVIPELLLCKIACVFHISFQLLWNIPYFLQQEFAPTSQVPCPFHNGMGPKKAGPQLHPDSGDPEGLKQLREC